MKRRLFEPVEFGALKLKYRTVMPPMLASYGDTSGYVTQRQIDYYVERAKNKVGLVVVEATCVAQEARGYPKQLNVYNDSFIPGLSKLAMSIRETGAACFLELYHGGRSASSKFNGGIQPVSSSAIAQWKMEMPRALPLDEIDDRVEAFAQSALRAKKAGFNGVLLHFANGYLISQFLSPLINKRTDKYGGDLRSRARLPVEIVQRVRERVGADYTVFIRINAEESIKGGLTLRETLKVIKWLEDAGINGVDLSAGFVASSEEGFLNGPIPHARLHMAMPHGYYLPSTERVKKAIKIPVIAVGRLDDPRLAEETLAKGKADLIAVGRGLIADPALFSKIYNERYDDIRKCICCDTCAKTVALESNLRCTVNPETGREEEYRIKPALRIKKVLVIGGGPGGMEAARVAGLRGHKVTLVEKKPFLGGTMVAAAAPSFRRDIGNLTEYLSTAIRKAGVEARINAEFDQGKVLAFKPDAVILATGASSKIPAIPGLDTNNVIDAIQVLEGKAKTGSKVVVVGGGSTGCEVAAHLAQGGAEVTIVEMRDTDYSDDDGLAPDLDYIFRRWLLFEVLPSLAVDIVGKACCYEVKREGLVVEYRDDGRELIPADTIIFAAGMKPNNNLKEKLQGRVPELYEVGDCVKPRHIIDAIDDAARVARLV